MPQKFNTTRWSLVLRVQSQNEDESHDALDSICRYYWEPLYVWLRSSGYPVEKAEDHLQGFFVHALSTELFKKADAQQGRLRNFLLVSLKRYIANDYQKQTAQKRGGGQAAVSLDFVDAEATESKLGGELSDPNNSPAELFEKRWAHAVLGRAMDKLQEKYSQRGKGELFNQLKPMLTEIELGESYAKAAAALHSTEGAVRVAFHRLKGQFRNSVREEVARTLSKDEDLEEEMLHLLTVLSK